MIKDKLDRDCKREQRIIWLILHYSLWADLPEPPQLKDFRAWYEWRKQYSKPIVKAMQDDGVLSEKTGWDCINLNSHIADALGVMEGKAVIAWRGLD